MGTVEENKALISRFYELLNQRDVDAANELLAPSSFREGVTWEQNKQFDIMTFKAFPDMKMTIVDIIAEGNKVAVIRNMTGTHTGEPFMGIPATGKKMDSNSTFIVRIDNNKVVEVEGTRDFLGMWTQLGVLPSMKEFIQAYKDSLK